MCVACNHNMYFWSSNSISMSEEENTVALFQGFSSLLKHLGYKEIDNK